VPGWYYAKDGQQQGPVSGAELKQLAAKGQLKPDDLVFPEGGTQWVEASTVKGLFPAAASQPVAPPPAPAPAPAPAEDGGGFDFDSGGIAVSTPTRGGRGAARRAAVVQERSAETDEDPPVARSLRSSGGGFGDILAFRKMITPVVIQILFWIGVLISILLSLGAAGFAFIGPKPQPVLGLIPLIVLPFLILGVRIYCELLILLFRIYDTLVEIRDQTRKT